MKSEWMKYSGELSLLHLRKKRNSMVSLTFLHLYEQFKNLNITHIYQVLPPKEKPPPKPHYWMPCSMARLLCLISNMEFRVWGLLLQNVPSSSTSQ